MFRKKQKQTEIQDHTCVSCQNVFQGNYCNLCGEKAFDTHSKSFSHFLEEVAHFFFHIDGKLFNTLKIIIRKPGMYAKQYCEGVRKQYINPITLYLFIGFLYVVLPFSVTGLRNSYQQQIQITRIFHHKADYAKAQIAKKGISESEFAQKYDLEVEKYTKLFVIILVPLFFILVLALQFFNKGVMYLYDHFIVTLELNSIFILGFFIILPLLLSPVFYFCINVLNIPNEYMGEGFALAVLGILIPLYTYTLFKRFYNQSFPVTLLKSIVVVILVLPILDIYRGICFYLICSLI